MAPEKAGEEQGVVLPVVQGAVDGLVRDRDSEVFRLARFGVVGDNVRARVPDVYKRQ